jgi:transcriptional regulator with XRE-family HTH domain
MATTSPSRRSRPRLPLATRATFLLAQSGYTQSDLAAALGCDRSFVSLVFSTRRRVPERMAKALSELIGDDAAKAVLDACESYKPASAIRAVY